MKMFLLMLLFMSVSIYAAGGDTLEYDTGVEDFADGDTMSVDVFFHPFKDSVQSITNGRLGNINLAADANIALSKLDTSTTMTKLKVDTIRGNPDIDSIQGKPFIDSIVTNLVSTDTIYTRALTAVNVNIDTIVGSTVMDTITGNVRFTENISAGGSLELTTYIASPLGIFDTAFVTNGLGCNAVNTGQGPNEVYAMDQNVRTTDTVTFDTLTITNGLKVGSFSVGSANYDSITIGGGQFLKSYEEGTFACSLSVVLNEQVGTGNYVRIGNQVTLSIPGLNDTLDAATYYGIAIKGVPASLRPTSTTYCSGVTIYENGAPVSGLYDISSSGLSMRKTDDTQFANVNNCGTGSTTSQNRRSIIVYYIWD